MSNISVCTESTAIVDHVLVRGSLVVGAVLGPLGIVLNVILLFALKQASAFHLNVRAQIANISVASSMFSLCFVVRAICFMVWRARPADYDCEFRISAQTCVLAGVPYTLCTGALLASICAVGIERAIATRLHASYEGCSHQIAYLMVGLCWINGPIISLSLFMLADEGHVMPVCVIMLASRNSLVAVVWIAEILLSVAILVEYVVLIRVNERKLFDYCANRALLKLTSRLQLRHNLQLAEMLLPSVIIHTSIMTISTCVVLSLLYSAEGAYAPEDYGICFVLNVLVVVYTIVHPVICFWRCEILRRELVRVPVVNRFIPKICPKSESITGRVEPCSIVHNDELTRQAAHEKEMEAHFMLLEAMWEKGPIVSTGAVDLC